MIKSRQDGFSADVSLELHVRGEVLQLAKVGPTRVVLREPRAIPAGEAELVITIDGSTDKKPIIVAAGCDGSTTEVHYW